MSRIIRRGLPISGHLVYAKNILASQRVRCPLLMAERRKRWSRSQTWV